MGNSAARRSVSSWSPVPRLVANLCPLGTRTPQSSREAKQLGRFVLYLCSLCNKLSAWLGGWISKSKGEEEDQANSCRPERSVSEGASQHATQLAEGPSGFARQASSTTPTPSHARPLLLTRPR